MAQVSKLKQLEGSQAQALLEELMQTFPNDTRMASKIEGKLSRTNFDQWKATGRMIWDEIENNFS